MKVCRTCSDTKPPELFTKNSKNKDGLGSYCKACSKSYKAKWYENNREHVDAYNRNYYHSNEDFREYLKKKNSDFQKDQRPTFGFKVKKNSREAKRRAAKLQATPQWLTNPHLTEIENLYWLAQDLKAVSGQEYHVDHIIPLQGKQVCGLHVPWNLQILPSEINISKSNRV